MLPAQVAQCVTEGVHMNDPLLHNNPMNHNITQELLILHTSSECNEALPAKKGGVVLKPYGYSLELEADT